MKKKKKKKKNSKYTYAYTNLKLFEIINQDQLYARRKSREIFKKIGRLEISFYVNFLN